jgi:hypothetical protein
MKFARPTSENAAATKTFGTLRIEQRVLMTPSRTIPIASISAINIGSHAIPKPRGLYWLFVALFAAMTWGSMRPDFSLGTPAPTAFSFVLGIIMLVFVFLALRRDDDTDYLLIASSDGVLSRFTAADNGFLDEVFAILTDKINRGDEQSAFNINFETCQIETLSGGTGYADATPRPNGSAWPANSGGAPAPAAAHNYVAPATPNGRNNGQLGQLPSPVAKPSQRRPGAPVNGSNGAGTGAFVDYAAVLPAIVEMHRFYGRQPGTQHLEQRLSELEMLMRAGTPTPSQKARVRELTGEMSSILQAYPQAVDLFQHIGSLV